MNASFTAWAKKFLKQPKKEKVSIEDESKAGVVPNQWALLNRTLLIYKASAVGLSALALGLVGLAFFQASVSPAVVVEKCDEKIFTESKRQAVPLADDDIRHFIERWIKLRYTWKSSDVDAVVRAIEPVSTEGFRDKVKDYLTRKKAQPGAKEQQIDESATNIEVTLTDKDATVAFDQIVRINGIPIVVPSQVSLQLVQGRTNRWNPLGLYVNGVIEHEDK